MSVPECDVAAGEMSLTLCSFVGECDFCEAPDAKTRVWADCWEGLDGIDGTEVGYYVCERCLPSKYAEWCWENQISPMKNSRVTRSVEGDSLHRMVSRAWWQARFAAHFWRLTRVPPRYAWQAAQSWMEMLDGDTSESPRDCADEEIG